MAVRKKKQLTGDDTVKFYCMLLKKKLTRSLIELSKLSVQFEVIFFLEFFGFFVFTQTF